MAATENKQNGTEKQEDLWSAILNDVAVSSRRNNQHITKTLLVLGDVSSGKSTLVDQMCRLTNSSGLGGKFPLSGCSLEYRFIDIQDEETDDLLDRMGVWILDGVVWHSQLLPFVLTRETLPHTTVLLVADLSQPWGILESLERWAEVVRKHIGTLDIPPKEFKEMEEKMVAAFQAYTDPEEAPLVTEGESVTLPLGETTLTNNLGVPVVVVCCKSDSITDLEKTHGYRDDHFDFIQQSIRKFCLNYGAALFYVSSKEDKNVSVLLQYLIHRGYSLPFKTGASVVDKDSVFIPSGWDNENKISILYEHMKDFSPSDSYESVIIPPKTTQLETHVGEVTAEEDQVFLMAQQAHLVRNPKPAGGAPPPSKDKGSPVQRPAGSPRNSLPAAADSGDGKPQANETVLATFFNSLLSNKKQPGGRGVGRTSQSRVDVEAEIGRMQNKKT